MSPFSSLRNEGYICDRDIPFQSVTFDVTSTMTLGVPMEYATTTELCYKGFRCRCRQAFACQFTTSILQLTQWPE